MDLHIVNPSKKEHLLSPSTTQKYSEDNSISSEGLRKVLLGVNNDENRRAKVAKVKGKDQVLSFNASKSKVTGSCNNCYASQYIFSHYKVGGDEGPSQERMEELERWVGGGYIYGNKFGV